MPTYFPALFCMIMFRLTRMYVGLRHRPFLSLTRVAKVVGTQASYLLVWCGFFPETFRRVRRSRVSVSRCFPPDFLLDSFVPSLSLEKRLPDRICLIELHLNGLRLNDVRLKLRSTSGGMVLGVDKLRQGAGGSHSTALLPWLPS